MTPDEQDGLVGRMLGPVADRTSQMRAALAEIDQLDGRQILELSVASDHMPNLYAL